MDETQIQKPFLRTLRGEVLDSIPFWFMRQAGRYLPEYRELRAQAGGFLDMAYNPKLACEITMQPIRRFGMDAAIIFSDILVVPHALGQHLEFVAGEGPKLDALNMADDIAKLKPEMTEATFVKVFEALSQTSAQLKSEGFDQTALIGFAGAPWTVACYMVQGGGSKDFEKVRKWAYSDPESFQKLIDILIESTAEYLRGQIKAGAEAVQIFDSWSGVLEANQFHRWVIAPTRQLIEKIKHEHPDIPIIGFPRGAGVLYRDYTRDTGITAVSTDHNLPTQWVASALQTSLPVQGNLDPIALLAGGNALKLATEKIFNDLAGGPYVFNLGHGVIKDTPVEHVEYLVDMIKAYKR
ncbi:MAG: uroporphyrinogen decarboxylase [Pseudomonadota bacterium]